MVVFTNLDVIPPPAGRTNKGGIRGYPIAYGTITSLYADRRNGIHYPDGLGHGGVDVGVRTSSGGFNTTDEDNRVLAPAAGYIAMIAADGEPEEYLGHGHNFGHSVCINHGRSDVDGITYYTTYSHLRDYPSHLQKGAHIGAGDFIGIVGATGFARGAHLHWGMGSEPGWAYNRAFQVQPTTDPYDFPFSTDERSFNPLHPRFRPGGQQDTTVVQTREELNSKIRKQSSRFYPQSPLSEAGGLRRRNFSLVLPTPTGSAVEINQDYKISFTIEEGTDSPTPGRIRIYNLAGVTETFLGRGAQEYEVYAGYGPHRKLISSGIIAKVSRGWEPPNRVTDLILGTPRTGNASKMATTFIGQTVADIFNALCDAEGLAHPQYVHLQFLEEQRYDFTVNGPVVDAIGRLATIWNLDHFIQSGRLRLLSKQDAVSIEDQSTIYTITSLNGMIGIPVYLKTGDATQGDTAMRVTTVLNPDVATRGFVRVRSRVGRVDEIDEVLSVTKIRHTGDTREGVFRTEITGTLAVVDQEAPTEPDKPTEMQLAETGSLESDELDDAAATA